MQVIVPQKFTPAMLLSENLSEMYALWSSTTAYVIGDIVLFEQFLYRSIRAGTNFVPNMNPVYWIKIGPSNSYAMFDDQVTTTSKSTNTIQATFKFGLSDSLAVLNCINVNSVRLVVRDAPNGLIVYDESIGLSGDSRIVNWRDYFLLGFDYNRTTAVFLEIPVTNLNAVAEFTATSQGPLEVGQITFGAMKDLGLTEYGATAGIIDYSTTMVNEFGERLFVRRNFSKRLSATAFVENDELNRMFRLLSELRATPALWLGSEDTRFDEPLILFGFTKTFDIEIPYPNNSLIRFEIEGLV